MSINNDYVIKRKEIIDKLVKEANLLKKEEIFDEDIILALIGITIEENKKYFVTRGENKSIKEVSIEIMNIIKKQLHEENKEDIER